MVNCTIEAVPVIALVNSFMTMQEEFPGVTAEVDRGA